jgi:tight adherence protein B
MVASGITVVAAALAAMWAIPERPRALLQRRLRRGTTTAVPRKPIWIVAVCVGALGLVTLADRPHLMVVGAVGVGASLAAAQLVLRERERAARVVRRSHTIDLCDALVAELRAGQPPSTALDIAAAEWPELETLGHAASRGADVPRLLRSLAERPGAEPLLHLAAGWEVAHRSGARLADVLERLSDSLRSDEDVRLEIAGALGPPRATARLLAVLPVFGALLGTGLGADPIGVLVGSLFGAVCLAAGAALAVAGLFWVERIAAAAEV